MPLRFEAKSGPVRPARHLSANFGLNVVPIAQTSGNEEKTSKFRLSLEDGLGKWISRNFRGYADLPIGSALAPPISPLQRVGVAERVAHSTA
jgi:hypothetical protein